MSNSNELLSEIAKNTRRLLTTSCCNHNSIDQTLIEFGGVDTKTFLPKTANSIAWLVESGSVNITIDGGTAIEYTNSGIMGFDSLNNNTITFEVVTGSTVIQWTY